MLPTGVTTSLLTAHTFLPAHHFTESRRECTEISAYKAPAKASRCKCGASQTHPKPI